MHDNICIFFIHKTIEKVSIITYMHSRFSWLRSIANTKIASYILFIMQKSIFGDSVINNKKTPRKK